MQLGKTWKFCENVAGKVSKYELKIEKNWIPQETQSFLTSQ